MEDRDIKRKRWGMVAVLAAAAAAAIHHSATLIELEVDYDRRTSDEYQAGRQRRRKERLLQRRGQRSTENDVSNVPSLLGISGLVDAAFVHHFRMQRATFEKLLAVRASALLMRL